MLASRQRHRQPQRTHTHTHDRQPSKRAATGPPYRCFNHRLPFPLIVRVNRRSGVYFATNSQFRCVAESEDTPLCCLLAAREKIGSLEDERRRRAPLIANSRTHRLRAAAIGGTTNEPRANYLPRQIWLPRWSRSHSSSVVSMRHIRTVRCVRR